MEKSWRIAIAQIAVVDGNKAKNLEKIEKSIEQAYNQSADLLVLPELVLTGLVSGEQMKMLAESREGDSFKRLQKKLGTCPVHLVYSFPEYVSENEMYITTCFIHKNGEPLAYYRKTHLFSEESSVFSRGNELIEVNVDGYKLGLLTCYDIEFPEPARTLASQGAKLLVVNSANMAPYEHIHRLFVTARALENQCFVVYCNRIGSNAVYEYHGQSAVIGPDSSVLMEIEEDREMVKTVEISLGEIENATSVFNYLRERRPELYTTG
ncbi:carbon-nitrogen hydrolase family protein [Aneurinibacillus terranovensis]|uniref:carbon-nitrogen hydrolase family protein n=1 Tax=Aneurinibacillus terranovensis TaxID=278991 RepID=UPI000418A0F2|nr:carbon-nitrogen hydrolase family protein [Aneurinibacillus terranovensis]